MKPRLIYLINRKGCKLSCHDRLPPTICRSVFKIVNPANSECHIFLPGITGWQMMYWRNVDGLLQALTLVITVATARSSFIVTMEKNELALHPSLSHQNAQRTHLQILISLEYEHSP